MHYVCATCGARRDWIDCAWHVVRRVVNAGRAVTVSSRCGRWVLVESDPPVLEQVQDGMETVGNPDA